MNNGKRFLSTLRLDSLPPPGLQLEQGNESEGKALPSKTEVLAACQEQATCRQEATIFWK